MYQGRRSAPSVWASARSQHGELVEISTEGAVGADKCCRKGIHVCPPWVKAQQEYARWEVPVRGCPPKYQRALSAAEPLPYI
jgi:hypothetical protein